jgi:hypothetical protein
MLPLPTIMSFFLSTVLMLDRMPWWACVTAALGFGVLSAVIVYAFIVPWQKKKIIMSHNSSNNSRVPNLDATDNKETTALSVISQRTDATTRHNEPSK